MATIRAADLFCGAGGASTGLAQAAERLGRKLDLVAVNHWARAVETHSKNHPKANHHCEDLLTLDPSKAVPSGKLDLLIAAPECTHHSNARGGKPRSDQSRATAWCVQRWATALRIDRILVENVPEFATWGPLGADGKPLKSRCGETFRAWVKALESLGYRVEHRTLNSADFGAATSRRRLFVQAVKGRRPIVWPDPTHARRPEVDGMFADRLPWRGAREVIDWTLTGESIFTRKRPLSANTLRRIEAGLRKFGGAAAEPFLIALRHMANDEGDLRGCRSLDAPTPTVTASGTNIGLVEPFLMGMSQSGSNGDRLRPAAAPFNTITTADDTGLVEPFLIPAGGPRVDPRSTADPMGTVLTRDHLGLVEPFLVPTFNGEREGQAPRTHAIDAPHPTVIASRPTHGLVQPFLLPHRQHDRMDVDGLDQPMRTVTATNGGCNAICEPFVLPYYANGQAESVGGPLRTVTAVDRFGLVTPDGRQIDIRFRMLQPHELAAAMGFPSGYELTGNRAERVRQVGNAIEVNQARALAIAMLEAS